jgi:hypothetical protein
VVEQFVHAALFAPEAAWYVHHRASDQPLLKRLELTTICAVEQFGPMMPLWARVASGSLGTTSGEARGSI